MDCRMQVMWPPLLCNGSLPISVAVGRCLLLRSLHAMMCVGFPSRSCMRDHRSRGELTLPVVNLIVDTVLFFTVPFMFKVLIFSQ